MRYSIKTVHLEGVPLLAPMDFEPAAESFAGYPSYCGAGDGWGDRLIPETLLGLSVSPACHIHDKTWDRWQGVVGFLLGNALFLVNMISIIYHRSAFLLRPYRFGRAILYFIGVTTFGRSVFFSKKRLYIATSILEIAIFCASLIVAYYYYFGWR